MTINPFTRPNPSEPHLGDPKKMGFCGAPQCRCTPLLLALCIALSGLVLVGVGSCVVGFMGNDDAPKALGASLVVIGFIMMIAGAVCFIYDNYFRHRFPMGQTVGYAYQPQESTQFDQPSTSYGAAAPSTTADIHREHKSDQNIAPPPYESVQQKPAVHGNVSRGSNAKHLRV